MLVPIPTFFNVVAFSNLSMQNSTFPRVIMLLKCCFASFSLISLLMIAAISHIFQCENFFELLLQNAYIILHFVRMTGIITKKLAINVRRYESKLHELNLEAKINKIWNKGNCNNISRYHQVWSESFGKKLLINGVRWKFIKIKKCGKWHQYDNNQIWQKTYYNHISLWWWRKSLNKLWAK